MTAQYLSDWVAVLIFSAVAGGAGLVGVWLMVRHERLARRYDSELITFASGLLVGGSLLHLLPRGGELAGLGAAMGWALTAFVFLYVAENHFVPHPHGRSDDGAVHGAHSARERVGSAAVLGLALHGLLDGVAVGAGFSESLLTGSVIVTLVIAHKLPVGIASMSVLYHAGTDRRTAAWLSSGVALVTPVAVLASFALLRGASDLILGAFVAGAGGAFLYVGAADLLPEGQASGVARNTVIFLLGVALVVAMLALPHGAAH